MPWITSCGEGSHLGDFPFLRVVEHQGRRWSLDNRRLWVFKKAAVQNVRVRIVSCLKNPRLMTLMEDSCPKERFCSPGFWPRVRGPCRSYFPAKVPAAPEPTAKPDFEHAWKEPSSKPFVSHDQEPRPRPEPRTEERADPPETEGFLQKLIRIVRSWL